MINRPFSTVLARLGLVAAILATLMILAPVASAAETYTYPENGTDPVATFSATDADGDAIVWGLDGEDKGDFEIADGVLTFKKTPDFENPADERADNVYKVKVTASGGSIDVEVTVEDVDEPGKPTLDKPQPQVGRGLVADGPKDPDLPVTDVTWQWARSMDKETWEDIGNPSASGSRNPVAADIDHYLRATAMYTDKHGSGKTAEVVSENPVEERTRANAKPNFDDHEDSDTTAAGKQIARMVDENAKDAQVGKPITAKDDDDALLYELIDPDTAAAPDILAFFKIDERTAQITTKVELDSDADGDDTDTAEDTYTATVKVTDPSGASETVTVVITVNNVNDAPKFPADPTKTLYVNERETAKTLRTTDAVGGTPLDAAAYVATDDDAADTAADLTYSVGGADKDKFSISNASGTAGTLTVHADHTPDFEKQKEYKITLMVEDDEFAMSKLDVTVKVRDAEDPGTVKLNVREPQIGKAVLATLTDEDGIVGTVTWAWARVAETSENAECPAVGDGSYVVITGATSASYTPKAGLTTDTTPGDQHACLQVTATYKDGFDTDTDGVATTIDDGNPPARAKTERAVQAEDPANTAPEFAKDQDLNTPGDQAVAVRSVAENMDKADVGSPVTATDEDLLMYAISDTVNFSVNNDGQIKTKVKLDYESLPEDAKYHMVELTATDPSGATDTVMVQINVTDENDGAVISAGPAVNTAPAFDGDTAERMVYENMPAKTSVGDPVAATDEDAGQTLTYTLNGGGGNFEIGSDGQITTTASLDHEAAPSYTVTVTASDGQDENATDTIEVTIAVVDRNPGCTVEGENALTNDCETLLAAKDELEGDGELDWSEDMDVNDWTGVTVGGDEGAMRVTMLGLHGQSLSGTIPAGLGDLDALETLYLHRNSLSGMVPGELGNLTNLTMLRVDNNELDGIEEGIGGASSLVTFYAHRNHLKGTIPADLGNLDSLEWLRLDSQISSERPDDGLTGSIPAELANMDSIERLYLHRNKLSGEIPAALGNSTTLTHITLQQNDLSGNIPDLSGMTSLVWLGLYSNELTGGIPATLGMLSNLQRLYLHTNSLTGSVPAEIGNLTNLTNLWLENNNLSGALPNELDNLTNLERVRIAPNGFTGCVPAALANAESTDAADLGLETCGSGG